MKILIDKNEVKIAVLEYLKNKGINIKDSVLQENIITTQEGHYEESVVTHFFDGYWFDYDMAKISSP